MSPVLSRKLTVLLWFAIVAVVWIHAYDTRPVIGADLIPAGFNIYGYLEDVISNGLTRFAVPLFLAISGYLFFRPGNGAKPDFRVKIAKRVRTLFVPFVIWNCIGMALVVAARNLPWFREFMPQYLADMSWEQFARLFVTYPVNFPLWYLRNLFLLALLSPLIYLFCRDRAGAIVWLVLMTVLWSHEKIGTDIVSAESVLFFSLGAAAALRSVPLSKLHDFNAWLAFALVWLAVNLVRSWIVFGPMPEEEAQTWALILSKMSYLLGLWVVWFGYDFLVGDVPEHSPLWPWFGLSFYLFVAHQPLYNIFRENFLARLGHHGAEVNYAAAFAVYLVLPAATIAGLSLVGALIRKNAPPLHRLLTGGR